MSAEIVRAFSMASEYFRLALGAAIDDATKLREAVTAQVEAMRACLALMPIEVNMSPGEADALFRSMDSACDALHTLVSSQADAMDATARECRRMTGITSEVVS